MAMPGKSFVGPPPPLTAAEEILRDRLSRHVRVLASDIGERNVWTYDALNRSADYLAGEFRAFGYETRGQTYDCRGKLVRNIEVELRGTTKPKEVFVIGGHYDSVHVGYDGKPCPGANDNGTGVAATIELARLLKESTGSPARTIRFVAFVNEEPPFFQTEQMGSLVYARACKARGDNIVGMISMETIGYYSDAPHSQHYPWPFSLFYPSTGNFITFVGNRASRGFISKCVGSFRSHTQFPSEGAAIPGFVTGIGWSDHWSFWQAGYPALMVTDTAPFRYVHYHTAQDTHDKIDFDKTARVVAGVARVIDELAR